MDAMLLFADRGAATGGFELTPRTTPIVNVICRRLDANPLAIEMAAAQLATLSVQEVAERLDDRFSLLSLARRGVPARHRTLQAVVEWSYHLLDERERALFDRLSWFEGEFTIAAAEAAEASGTDTAAVLGRLVHKSLVQRIDRSDGPARYALSETLRHFGRHVVAGGHPISRSTG